MGPDDLYDRLSELGYTTTTAEFGNLETHLHYYQNIDLPPLDTAPGAATLGQLVDTHQAAIVIIDTLGRVTVGEENSNDTYRALARHTIRVLRATNTTTIVLDHTGKDATRGARGASGKGDSADVMWAFTSPNPDRITLTRTKGRQPWVPPYVNVQRTTHQDRVTHTAIPLAAPQDVLATVNDLTKLGVPVDATRREAETALREAGKGRRTTIVGAALKHRQRPALRPII
jgi:hypothetical protein